MGGLAIFTHVRHKPTTVSRVLSALVVSGDVNATPKDLYELLDAMLLSERLKRIDIEGDGNCMYHSLVDQLRRLGYQTCGAWELRQKAERFDATIFYPPLPPPCSACPFRRIPAQPITTSSLFLVGNRA